MFSAFCHWCLHVQVLKFVCSSTKSGTALLSVQQNKATQLQNVSFPAKMASDRCNSRHAVVNEYVAPGWYLKTRKVLQGKKGRQGQCCQRGAPLATYAPILMQAKCVMRKYLLETLTENCLVHQVL